MNHSSGPARRGLLVAHGATQRSVNSAISSRRFFTSPEGSSTGTPREEIAHLAIAGQKGASVDAPRLRTPKVGLGRIGQTHKEHVGGRTQVQCPVVGGQEQQGTEQRQHTELAGAAGTAPPGQEFAFDPRRHPRILEQRHRRHHFFIGAHRAPHRRSAARSSAFECGAPFTWRA